MSPIRTVLRINWLNLKRDRAALVLSFVLPIVFFSIFAGIFGGMGRAAGSGPAAIDVVLADLDQSETSGRFVAALGQQEALNVLTAPTVTEEQPAPGPYSLADAKRIVRQGRVPVAVVLPAGFGETFGNFGGSGEPVTLIYDAADPIARHSVNGLLQASAMQAAPDLLMHEGLELLEQYGGPLTPEQQAAVGQASSFLQQESSQGGSSQGETGVAALVAVEAVDVRSYDEAAEDEPSRSMVAYYAAGIGVMFLLFSMAGAGGAVLDEEESGVLERLLSSNLSMSQLLIGKWLFFAGTGLVQVVLMFLWGALVFGLELWTPQRLVGFLAMATVTAAAASAFGIVLATACRTRSQLSGTSTIVILIMSALGGSMVPRFIMPKFMDTTALFTINGWALDGFLKVFWYDQPGATVGQAFLALVPQLFVLSALAVVFMLLARRLARRWETV